MWVVDFLRGAYMVMAKMNAPALRSLAKARSEHSSDAMLKISKSPTTRAGKPAGAALIAEAKLLVKLSETFPVLAEAITQHSSPKHRKAIVEIVRSAKTDTTAHSLAKLLDAGNTSAFLQKFEGVFVGVSQPADAEVPADHAAMLRDLGIADDEEAGEDEEAPDGEEADPTEGA